MANFNFTLMPWGDAEWVLDKLPHEPDWSFIGCLSPEERCVSAPTYFPNSSFLFVEIVEPSSPYHDSALSLLADRRKVLENICPKIEFLESIELLSSPLAWAEDIRTFVEKSNGKVVLDISCFPKRFFFYLLKDLLLNDTVEDFLVSYSAAESYFEGELAEEALSNSFLPSFQSTQHPPKDPDIALIGVGFMPFTMPDDIKAQYGSTDVALIFPYPSTAPSYQRSWEFLRQVENVFHSDLIGGSKICRVAPLDAPNALAHINMLTHDGEKFAIFAPYGPKPHSMAMCIYATLNECPVIYTQPVVYRPDYSIGIAKSNGAPITKLYCLKLAGKIISNPLS